MRAAIEVAFFGFMQERAIVEGSRFAAKPGQFSALPGRSEPDLFGSLDILYAAHILRRIDDVVDAAGRQVWLEHLLTYQDNDGWFRSRDKQVHGVEHATAYALGGLQILSQGDSSFLKHKLQPFRGLQKEINVAPSRTSAPFSLSLLHRLHFWRGSHRAAGIAAIVGAVQELGLSSNRFLGLSDTSDWLHGWWSYFAQNIEASTGYCMLAPRVLKFGFDTVYQFRHRPKLATMGGSVHLYWISEKLRFDMPHPGALIPATTALMQSTGLYEHEPYCIDLDANFLIGRALSYPGISSEHRLAGHGALASNRDAILNWFASRSPKKWSPNSHKLPGALAAVAEADRVLTTSPERRWRDVFETTWWL